MPRLMLAGGFNFLWVGHLRGGGGAEIRLGSKTAFSRITTPTKVVELIEFSAYTEY